eukprot:TRINITY_DN18026_c0_g1_i1.p1 TRINITY_DN18026_c0_g1~~TRINITY_DN18026_c0_g1_i1.p1  ORF type:complete len:279 (-),score=58.09 TRINITY_DN18026_c0_g1_i1:666-1478(-)
MNVLGQLEGEQVEKFKQFRKWFGKENYKGEEAKWLTDMCLWRYLRAREWDLEQSKEMLENTLKWRREFKPLSIRAEDIQSESEPGKMYFSNSFDKKGRPILYMKPGKDNSSAGTPEGRLLKLKYLVYCLECCIAAMDEDNGIEKMCLVVDYKGTGIAQSSVSNIQVSLDCLNTLQDHYPERLGVACFINNPWVFSAFWKCLTPFIAKVTIDKVKFYGSGMGQLLDHIDADTLEKDYGGNCDFQYDHEAWKAANFQKKKRKRKKKKKKTKK